MKFDCNFFKDGICMITENNHSEAQKCAKEKCIFMRMLWVMDDGGDPVFEEEEE